MKSVITKLALVAFAISLIANTSSAQEEPAILTPADSVNKVYVDIAQSRNLVGSLVQLDTIKMTTDFGDVSIPFAKVDGIKMNIGNDSMAVVAFKNGDVVSGKIEMDKLILKTSWGQAQIDPVHIETITLDQNGRFYEEKSAGGGWRFSKAVQVPSKTNSSRTPRSGFPPSVPRQFGQ